MLQAQGKWSAAVVTLLRISIFHYVTAAAACRLTNLSKFYAAAKLKLKKVTATVYYAAAVTFFSCFRFVQAPS